MAYGDEWDFKPGLVEYTTHSDGTVVPRIEVIVFRNSVEVGYIELHMHRTKYSPHASVGVTSRVSE